MYYDELEPYEETPGMTALGAVPGIGLGMVFNQQRAGRTITHGLGKGKKYRNTATLRAAAANTLRPSNWSKFGSYDALHHRAGKYSPYALAGLGNSIANFGSADGINQAYLNEKNKAIYFGRGTLARMGAMSNLARGGSTAGIRAFLSDAGKIDGVMPSSPRYEFLSGLYSSEKKGFFGYKKYKAIGGDRSTYMYRMAASSQGLYSQRLLGYYARVTSGNPNSIVQGVLKDPSLQGVMEGMERATSDLKAAKLTYVDGGLQRGGQRVTGYAAIKGAESGSRMAAARVVGATHLGRASEIMGGAAGRAAFAAMLAYDIGKLAGAGLKAGVNLVGDAAESVQGSIQKPIFGMGFKDTQFAATSRARGVMAIQNSRMNARSAMGSEAGMMAAHFG